MPHFPTATLDYAAWLSPAIQQLDSVGSREIEAEVTRRKARGQPVIPLHAFPVITPPPHLVEAAAAAAACTSMPGSNGLLELREALAAAVKQQYDTDADPDSEVLVTAGAMHALHVAFTAMLAPGDEVILTSPCYFFGGLIQMTGANPVYVEAREQDGYAPDFERIRSRLSPRTKVIVVSSPVNPTGYVYSRRDIEQFVTLAEEHNVLLLSDESYDRMLYDGRRHISPLHLPEGRRRTILVKSFTKSYALPLLRVGYMIAPWSLMAGFRKVLEWTVLHCPVINQKVALAAITGPQSWLAELSREFEKRRNEVIEGLATVPNISCVVPSGGPFLFPNVSRVASDCNEFAARLLHEYGVPAVPGRCFHVSDHVRIAFGGTTEAVADLIAALRVSASLATLDRA